MCYCRPSVRTPFCNNCAGKLYKDLKVSQAKVAELEAADEIESLRAELAAAQMMNSSLTGELAECQRDLHNAEECERVSQEDLCAISEALEDVAYLGSCVDGIKVLKLQIVQYHKELEECQKAWDELNHACDEWEQRNFKNWTALQAAQARIAELVEALETAWSTKYVDGVKAKRMMETALARTDNMEALDAYRDQVIDEVALAVGSHTDVHISIQNLIRALKKGK